MPLTLLQIISQAQLELGVGPGAAGPTALTTVVGSTDLTTLQMWGLANDVLDEMRQMNRWTAQQFEYNIAVTPAINVTGNFTKNSPTITNLNPTVTTLIATNNLAAYFWAINAEGVPTAARIQALNAAANTITMTMEYIGTTATNVTIALGQDTYPMPSDFDYFNNQTMWDRTNFWALLGPTSPQADQWHRSGIFTTGPRRFWRKQGQLADQWRLWPPPFELANPLQLVFEYLSLNAVGVLGSNSNFAQYFANDTDQPTLNDQAVKRGVKWKFWEVKGFDFTNWKNDWIDYVEQLAAKDGGAKTLSLARRPDPFLISPWQIQDGSWPGTSN